MAKENEKKEPEQPASWLDIKLKIPVLEVIRKYQVKWLPGDLTSGLVICAVTIPSALAYGEMAGVHRVNGLYASSIAMLVYGLLGSSRRLIIGAEAAVAILVASSLSSIVPGGGDAERHLGLVLIQAMMVGSILIAAGFARIGFIADFFPETVVVGFISGVGLIIIFSQLGSLFGLELKQADFFPRLVEFFSHLNRANGLTFGVGLICLASLLFSHRLLSESAGAGLHGDYCHSGGVFLRPGSHGHQRGWRGSRRTSQAWPAPLSFADAVMVLPTSVGVAFISYADIIITGRAFTQKGTYELNADQELFALGLANFANGLTQGFTVGASHSRTAVNDLYNGKTQLAGILGAVFLGLFLLFLTGLLRKVPVVALSAIVVAAGLKLLRPRETYEIWRKHRLSGYVTMATALAVLLLGIMTGILISVGLAIIIILRQLSRPHEDIRRPPEVPGLMIYRFGAPLLFFNVPYFAARVQAAIDSADPRLKISW